MLPFQIALMLYAVVHSAFAKSLYPHLQCRDPGVGNGNDQVGDRKFLILTGRGGGIGNYLVFYPTAFYFAALTGRVSRAIVCALLSPLAYLRSPDSLALLPRCFCFAPTGSRHSRRIADR